MRKLLFSVLFALCCISIAAAQQPSPATQQMQRDLQQAQQDGNDAKVILGDAEIQIARQRRLIEMLQQQNAQLMRQVAEAKAATEPPPEAMAPGKKPALLASPVPPAALAKPATPLTAAPAAPAAVPSAPAKP